MRSTLLSILFTFLLLHIGNCNVYGATNDNEKITITGTVVDEDNEPIIGSSVYLKSGSNTVGAVSDFYGKFTLNVVPEGETFSLTVSYIGYKTLIQSFYVHALTDSKGTVKVKMLEDKRKNKNKKSSIIAQNFSNGVPSMSIANALEHKSAQKKTPQQLYNEADRYYHGKNGVSKDYKKALELFLQAAEQGHAGAQTMVGYIYSNGIGVNEDKSKAFSWYQKAATQGNQYSQYNLGLYYENGLGVEKDLDTAAYWYEKSALQGYKSAQCKLGYFYSCGLGVTKNNQTAMQWYLKAAEQGEDTSMLNIGVLYETGEGVKKSNSQALAWYNKAAEKGNKTAKKYAQDLIAKGVKPATLKTGSSTYDFSFKNPTVSSSSTTKTTVSNSTAHSVDYSKMTVKQLCDEASKYYNGTNGVTKDYNKAFDIYEQAAKKGSASAQYYIAEMYYNGEGVEKDEIVGYQWYKKAADNGDSIACNRLGNLFYSGKTVPQNYSTAFSWYKKSAEKGYKWGQFNLGSMYYNGEGCNKDLTQAIAWLQKAADQNVPNAQNMLGVCYDNGNGVPENDTKAIEYFKKAANQGYNWGQYNLGYMYYSGRGCKNDYKQAVYWFQKAADQNNSDAYNMLGMCYRIGGYGISKDDTKAFDYYKQSAEMGYGWGQYNLANRYYNGEGCEKDYVQAVVWFQKAADQNIPNAQNMLGICYDNGYGVPEDSAKAVYYYKKAAGQGFDWGQYNLANKYYMGNGCEKDTVKAAYWFEKAATQGLADAQSLLAWGYFSGTLVNKDIKKALDWIEKAAQQGDAQTQSDAGYMYSEKSPYMNYEKAIYWTQKSANQNNPSAFNNLGWFYEHGYGVDKDLNLAFTYYKKAADLDYSGGMRHVGEFYENGWVVEKDVLEAALWYKKAAKAGNDKAKDNLSSITARLSDKGTTSSSPRQEATYVSTNSVKDLPPMGKRIALIIGNDDYGAQRLDNPVNDAQALNALLKLLGFEAEAHINLDKDETEKLVADFAEKAKNYDMALFYYAGHAIQSKGVNYLVPAHPEPVLNHADIQRKYVELPFIVNSMIDAEAKRNIIILDACRDTPDFIGVKTRGAKNGLASIIEPERFLVAYSTQAGMTAADGKGMEHSPYMTVLLEQLKVPGQNVDQLFVRVRDNVQEMTHNEQRPFFKNNLGELPSEKFYFNRGK